MPEFPYYCIYINFDSLACVFCYRIDFELLGVMETIS